MKATALLTFAALAGTSLLSRPARAQSGFTTLYNFTNGLPTGLTLANGGLYGAFLGGEPGGYGCGNVFFLQPPGAGGGAWTETVLYTFADTNDACNPVSSPIIGPGGVLYGVTNSGGANDAGALYELKPPASHGGGWTESILYSFEYPAYEFSVGLIIPGPGGSFYVANDSGVFQLQPPATSGGSWTPVWLQSIPSGPTSITRAPDGSLYVTTLLGAAGTFGKGYILQLTPPVSPGGEWTQTLVYNFPSMGQGGVPNSLAIAGDGTLYGTTYGQTYCCGDAAATVFELTPPPSSGGGWTYIMLENFGDGHMLSQPLILRSGRLFDAMVGLENSVFALTPASTAGNAWTLKFLHNFTGQPSGFWIVTQVMDGDGTIYGATQVSAYEEPPTGTVYRVAP